MSIRAMTWAMDSAPESLSSTQRHVLLVLADYVNDETGSAYPSLASLAARTGLSTRAIRNALRVLESVGIISTSIKGAAGSGAKPIPFDRRPNLYRWTANATQTLEVREERNAPRDVTERNHVPHREEPRSARERNDVPRNHHKNPYGTPTSTDTNLELSQAEAENAVIEMIRLRIPSAPAWLARKARPALDAGWTPAEVAREVLSESVENARSVAAVLGRRLEDLGTREPLRKPLRPSWCGSCDESTRLVEVAGDDYAVARCPECNPLTVGVAS